MLEKSVKRTTWVNYGRKLKAETLAKGRGGLDVNIISVQSCFDNFALKGSNKVLLAYQPLPAFYADSVPEILFVELTTEREPYIRAGIAPLQSGHSKVWAPG